MKKRLILYGLMTVMWIAVSIVFAIDSFITGEQGKGIAGIVFAGLMLLSFPLAIFAPTFSMIIPDATGVFFIIVASTVFNPWQGYVLGPLFGFPILLDLIAIFSGNESVAGVAKKWHLVGAVLLTLWFLYMTGMFFYQYVIVEQLPPNSVQYLLLAFFGVGTLGCGLYDALRFSHVGEE